jgi:hypothetical protein
VIVIEIDDEMTTIDPDTVTMTETVVIPTEDNIVVIMRTTTNTETGKRIIKSAIEIAVEMVDEPTGLHLIHVISLTTAAGHHFVIPSHQQVALPLPMMYLLLLAC